MVYKEEEVLRETCEYFDGDELATNVWVTKYALKNKKGELLEKTPNDMHDRLATEFHRIEMKYPKPVSKEKIRSLLDGFKYIVPQGSPMFGIGNKHSIQSLGNCFVIPTPYDSYGGILKSDEELAQLMKRRAGVGLDISSIRPRGEFTTNAAGTTDGIGVFMERYSNTCREVAQNGRRGALMITLSVHHPEISTFIDIKKDLQKVTGANISIRFSDEFMEAVKHEKQYEQRWPVDKETPKIKRNVNAREIWDKFIASTWESAEPGALFWDRIEQYTPIHSYVKKYPEFKDVSTNPCGELPLPGYDSCRLLLLNLFGHVDKPFEEEASFNFIKFAKNVQIAQRLMDNLVDLEIEKIDLILDKIKLDPEPEEIKKNEFELWTKIRKNCIAGRRTGLGITGLGDMLAAIGIKYGSQQSISFVDDVYEALACNAYQSSETLAVERGSFPIYDSKLEEENAYLKNLSKRFGPKGRRNIALLTTAPAGSVSLLTQTTSGCEPAFMLEYKRRRKVPETESYDFIDKMGDRWKEFTVHHHALRTWMKLHPDKEICDSPYHESTANEIDWINSVKLQAIAQKWVDHAISKTCNLPESATKEDVSKVYLEAWSSGCKGFTVYRDGCRTGVLVSKEEQNQFSQISATVRPKKLHCEIHHPTIKGEKWTIFVGLLDGKPYEVFGGLADKIELSSKHNSGTIIKRTRKKTRSIYDLTVGNGDDSFTIKDIVEQFDNSNYGTHTRLISLSLRHGANIEYVISQLQKDKESGMFTFSRVLARVLKKYIPDGTVSTGEKICPECGAENLIYQDGCVQCASCGWSKCS